MSNPNLLTVNRELGIGGFLKNNLGTIGTVVGGAAGAFVGNPMLGAQIGGGLGTMAQGALADKKKGRKALPGRRQPINIPGYTGTSASQGFTYAKGGRLPNSNQLLSIGQDAGEFSGPSHEEGGIKVEGGAEVEGGETMDFIVEGDSVRRPGDKTPYVFSKRLKVPGSNKSFADTHSNLVQRGVGDDKIRKLANLQESVNGNSASSKKEGGGPLPNIDLENMPTAPGQGRGTAGTLLNAGKQLLPYAGDLLNIGRGVFGNSDVPDAPRMSIPRGAIDEARKMPTEVNVNPQLANVSRSLRTLTASPNTSTQAKLAAHSNSLQAKDRILAQKENRENQLEGKKAQTVANLTASIDSRQAQANHQAQIRQQQNQLKADAAKSQLLSTGLAGLARTRQQQTAAKNQSNAQMMAVMAQLAGKDGAVRESTVQSILPMVKDPQMRKQLLQFIGQS
jgi:hypothetical protein